MYEEDKVARDIGIYVANNREDHVTGIKRIMLPGMEESMLPRIEKTM